MELTSLLERMKMEHLLAQLDGVCEHAAKGDLDYKGFLTQALDWRNMMYASSTRRVLLLSARLIFVFVVLAAGLDSPIRAQDAITSKVDDYIKAEMQRQHIPGLSLAVLKDGQIILAKGYGFANVEHQVPVKPETIFQSGSMGKQFTATAMMMCSSQTKTRIRCTSSSPNQCRGWVGKKAGATECVLASMALCETFR